MSSPGSGSPQRPKRTPLPSLSARPRSSGLDLVEHSAVDRQPRPDQQDVGTSGSRQLGDERLRIGAILNHPLDPVPSRLRKPEKAKPDTITDSDVADGEEDLRPQTEELTPLMLPPPALPADVPADMQTFITMQGIFERPAAQPTDRSGPSLTGSETPSRLLSHANPDAGSALERGPAPDETGEEAVRGEGARVPFMRWVPEDMGWKLKEFDPWQLPGTQEVLANPGILRRPAATFPMSGGPAAAAEEAAAREEESEDVGSVSPPPRQRPRVQVEHRHALPTLPDAKAANVGRHSVERTIAKPTPLQARKGRPARPKKEPEAPASASAASTPSVSPPAPPTLPKAPHAKTRNANLRADVLDGDEGEPNPNGPCERCGKSPTKRTTCRTPKDTTTGKKCNHCTRAKVSCHQPEPQPAPQPAQPRPADADADYDSDATIVIDDEDEAMQDAA